MIRNYFALYEEVLSSDSPMEGMLAQHQADGRSEAGCRLMTLWAEMIWASADLRRAQAESVDRVLADLELEGGIAEDGRYMLARMDALKLLGDFRSAAEWAHPLINQDPEFLNQSDRVERMGLVLLAAGDSEHALSLFDRARSSSLNHVRQIGVLGRAIALAQAGRSALSVEALRDVPHRDWPAPFQDWLFHARIHALTRVGHQEEALAYSEQDDISNDSVRSLMWNAVLELPEITGIQ